MGQCNSQIYIYIYIYIYNEEKWLAGCNNNNHYIYKQLNNEICDFVIFIL